MDIDDTGFELGMPTRVEMLEHQCLLLCNENDQLRRDLFKSTRNIEKLVRINQDLNAGMADLQVKLNKAYVEYVQEENRRLYTPSLSTWGQIAGRQEGQCAEDSPNIAESTTSSKP